MAERPHRAGGTVPYWALVVVLLGFGYLALFSIGMPFVLLGIALAVLFPFRHRPGVIAAAVASVVGLTAGYLLIAPLGCTGTSRAVLNGPATAGRTTCSSLLHLPYRGGGSYSPSLLPALVSGLVLAAIMAFAAYRLRSRSTGEPSATATTHAWRR